MGTDESTAESGRFARVRGRLPAPKSGEAGTSGVRERLSSLGIEGVESTRLRERFPTPGFGGETAVCERLWRLSVRERLPRPGVGGQLSVAGVSGRLPGTTVCECLSDAVPGAGLAVQSPSVERPAVSLPDRLRSVRERMQDSQTTTPEYFVGVVPESHETVRAALAGSPLDRSYVTYPKVLNDKTRGVEREAATIWVYRSWSLAQFQLHVPLFEAPEEDAVYVFYHHEYNWLRHPVEHLDAEYLNPEFGRDRVVELLETAGLTVETGREPKQQYPTGVGCREGGEPA